MKLTTKQAAAKLGVHQITLQNWVTSGTVPAPPLQTTAGGGSVRLWTERDIQQARKAIAKKRKG